jgi:hypothetical protein
MEQKSFLIIGTLILIFFLIKMTNKSNIKENFSAMPEALKREMKEKEVEIEVVDRFKLLGYDRTIQRTKDNNYKKVYYRPDLEQLKDLFPDTVEKDDKGNLVINYPKLLNYVLRGIFENTVMYDMEVSLRKGIAETVGRLEKEVEILKRLKNI